MLCVRKVWWWRVGFCVVCMVVMGWILRVVFDGFGWLDDVVWYWYVVVVG